MTQLRINWVYKNIIWTNASYIATDAIRLKYIESKETNPTPPNLVTSHVKFLKCQYT